MCKVANRFLDLLSTVNVVLTELGNISMISSVYLLNILDSAKSSLVYTMLVVSSLLSVVNVRSENRLYQKFESSILKVQMFLTKLEIQGKVITVA